MSKKPLILVKRGAYRQYTGRLLRTLTLRASKTPNIIPSIGCMAVKGTKKSSATQSQPPPAAAPGASPARTPPWTRQTPPAWPAVPGVGGGAAPARRCPWHRRRGRRGRQTAEVDGRDPSQLASGIGRARRPAGGAMGPFAWRQGQRSGFELKQALHESRSCQSLSWELHGELQLIELCHRADHEKGGHP